MTPGQRIKKARIDAGLSQQLLAEAISRFGDGKALSRTAIAQWESGATKEIEAANLLKTAKVLKVTPEWLQFGADWSPVNTDMRTVPVLSYQQAVSYMEFDKKSLSHIGVDQALAEVIGPQAFALIVKGNNMAPIFKSGDIVIIDPDTRPQPGEIIAAKLARDETTTLGKYRPLGKTASGSESFELIPLNEDWPKVIVNDNNLGHIIGTLVEHRCRRRISQPETVELERSL